MRNIAQRTSAAGVRLLPYAAVASISLAISWWVCNLGQLDWHVPATYYRDGIFTASWIKSIIDNGWYLTNPYVGAPTGLELHDFPMSESLHFLIIKLLSLVWPQHGVVLNVFYVLTYPLTALTTLFAVRRFKVALFPAMIVALLFAFTPYHFHRGPGHLFLASYYIVPLSLMVVLWTYLGELSLWRTADQDGVLAGRKRRWCGALAVCLLQASAGVYYAAFSCYFLAILGAVSGLQRRTWAPLATAGLLVATTVGGVALNVAPSLHYRYVHGPNTEVAQRAPVESEHYALKIAQMVLPLPGHRIDLLAKIRAKYDEQSPLTNENATATLGGIGAIGFIYLLLRLGCRRKANDDELLHALSVLTLAAILLGTMGGFGAVFNYTVSPQIRCYNRISIFISLFALMGIGTLLTDVVRRLGDWRGGAWLASGALSVLLAVGILDQTSQVFVPLHHDTRQQFYNDRDFVQQIETAVPAGGSVYQLPYMPFPECHHVHAMADYQHFRPYLHSQQLHWSYGCVRGRAGDAWNQRLLGQPVAKQVHDLSVLDFAGIYIDRDGYVDAGAGLENELKQLLGRQPLVSNDQKQAFFPLGEYAARLRAQVSRSEWQALRKQALGPLATSPQTGFDVELTALKLPALVAQDVVADSH